MLRKGVVSRNSDYAALAKTLTTSPTESEGGCSKFKSTLNPGQTLAAKSDLHEREALGHGIYLVKSRLEEGRENFEATKVGPFPEIGLWKRERGAAGSRDLGGLAAEANKTEGVPAKPGGLQGVHGKAN